ncbi:MAG: chemotaxis protein CheA [Bacillota bacterium]
MFSSEEIQVFLDELEEKIEILNDGFLALERDGDNPETIQEIFRAAHTVKGSSGILGYNHMSSLTHEMENLFSLLRDGRVRSTPHMVDVLLESLDTLKMLRDEVTGTGETGRTVDIGPVVEKLRGFREQAGTGGDGRGTAGFCPAAGPEETAETAFSDAVSDVIREAADQGYGAYRVRVDIDPDCRMKSVRAFLVFQTLEKAGVQVIWSEPPVDELEQGGFGAGFELLAVSEEDADRLRGILTLIAEVNAVTVVPVTALDEVGAGQAAAAPAPGGTLAPAGPVPDFPVKQADSLNDHKKAVRTVRIDVRKLDSLMNLVGELVIERTRLERFADLMELKYRSEEMIDTLNEISNHLGQITSDLQEEIMKARMLPIAQVFNRFPRMIRDLAHKLGKEVDLVIEGRDTELDRNVIEIISDPLLHLIRNAVDHGLEMPEERLAAGKPRAGTLTLRAFHQENHIVIIVEDDGRGVDPDQLRAKARQMQLFDETTLERLSDQEAMNLIFYAGFSTAANVSDVSGRGVGMDVVKSQIEQINGVVEMRSTPGQGTAISIKLPLTLAIIRALMVGLDSHVYAFPLSNVVETIHLDPAAIRMIRDSEVVVVRGEVLSLVRLGRLFRQRETGTAEKLYMVVIGTGQNRVGVVVDRLVGEQEIVIKSLGDFLGRIPGISGATILGDGKVALIVDVRALLAEITGIHAHQCRVYAAG